MIIDTGLYNFAASREAALANFEASSTEVAGETDDLSSLEARSRWLLHCGLGLGESQEEHQTTFDPPPVMEPGTVQEGAFSSSLSIALIFPLLESQLERDTSLAKRIADVVMPLLRGLRPRSLLKKSETTVEQLKSVLKKISEEHNHEKYELQADY